jgi:DNA-binding CsgD family transcriptional regulator
VAALARYQVGLRHAWHFGETPPIAYALGGVAGSLAAAGWWELAARFFGATEALCERSGLPFGSATMDRQRALGLPEPWQRQAEPYGLDAPLRDALAGTVTATLAALPDLEAAQLHWTSGRMLPAAEAVAVALAIEPNTLAGATGAATTDRAHEVLDPRGTGGPGGDLTRREREVLGLLCQRLTDPEIAEQLFLSPRTASKHVANILGKFGAANRREVAAIAARHGLSSPTF